MTIVNVQNQNARVSGVCAQHKQQESVTVKLKKLTHCGVLSIPSEFLIISFIVNVTVLLTYFNIEKYYHTYLLAITSVIIDCCVHPGLQ